MNDDVRLHAAGTRRRIAALCLASMLVVVIASAFLRHHGAGNALRAAWAGELGLARLIHRIAATLVLLGALALVVLARRARDRAALLLSSILLGAALLLSAVGVAAGASRAAPVVLINLLGGMVMLALCARLAAPSSSPSPPHVARAAACLLAGAALQAAAGAWASAHAAPECLGVSDCAAPALLHRVAGLLLGYALLLLGLWARLLGQRRDGGALALVALLLLIIGMLTAGTGSLLMPGLAVLHNALAAVAVALVVRLA